MPTELPQPWPSGPVVVSTPEVKPNSGCPGVRLSIWRNFLMSSTVTAASLPPALVFTPARQSSE